MLLTGCASKRPSPQTARNAFAAGDLNAAHDQLTTAADSGDRYAVASSLDLAIVELASGEHLAAERRLRDLRDHFDAQPKLSPISEAAAIATDDTVRIFGPPVTNKS